MRARTLIAIFAVFPIVRPSTSPSASANEPPPGMVRVEEPVPPPAAPAHLPARAPKGPQVIPLIDAKAFAAGFRPVQDSSGQWWQERRTPRMSWRLLGAGAALFLVGWTAAAIATATDAHNELGAWALVPVFGPFGSTFANYFDGLFDGYHGQDSSGHAVKGTLWLLDGYAQCVGLVLLALAPGNGPPKVERQPIQRVSGNEPPAMERLPIHLSPMPLARGLGLSVAGTF